MSDTIRVRCPGCNATLKVPSSKAGGTIGCPRCKQDVVVPSEEEVGSGPVLPVAEPPTPLVAPAAPPTIAPESPSGGFLNLDLRLNDPPASPPSAVPTPPASPAAAPSPPAAPMTPAVAPTLRPERSQLRTRDVVLPRTAVVAWTLLALLGLIFAFVAGLMIGHFLWR